MSTLQETRTIQGNLLEIIKILEQLRTTTNKKEKEKILNINKNNTLLQKVIYYTYSPYKIYNINKKTFNDTKKFSIDTSQIKFQTIFELLDFLTTVDLNDNIKAEILTYLALSPSILENLYMKMMLKNLQVGITITTINKIWKNLIPKFNIMLAKRYEDYAKKLKGDIIITEKIDGVRAVIIREENNTIIMNKQGKILKNIDILEDAKHLPSNMVYDGKLLGLNEKELSHKELYHSIGYTSKKTENTKLEYHIFDTIPFDEFKKGISKENCIDRKHNLINIFELRNFKLLKIVPILYIGNDYSQINKLLRISINKGKNGIIINSKSGKYECKRSKEILWLGEQIH